MAKQPRHHHFVPQFYLGGFAATVSARESLHVVDIEKGKQWPSTPKDSAHERDYHAVDLGSGQDPMVIEKKLAECEGKWALALRNTIEQKMLPEGDLLGDLLAFVAFMAVRIPRFRNQVTDFEDVIRLESEYIRAWSVFKDIKILLKTVPVVFRMDGAH